MDKGRIKQLTRFYLDDLGIVDVPDTDANKIDLDTLFENAYQLYAQETGCFPLETMGLLPKSSVHLRFSEIVAGDPGARLAAITTIVLDSGATGWTASTAYLVDQVVVPATLNGHRYICTTAGTSHTAAPAWPTGTGATVADGTVVWTEAGADSAIATPITLGMRPPAVLDQQVAGWRHQAAGTPAYWHMRGDRRIRITPAGSYAYPAYVEGCSFPDPADYATDADVPDIVATDHKLLAVGAALEWIVHNPNDEQAAKLQRLQDEWSAGIASATARNTQDGVLRIGAGRRFATGRITHSHDFLYPGG